MKNWEDRIPTKYANMKKIDSYQPDLSSATWLEKCQKIGVNLLPATVIQDETLHLCNQILTESSSHDNRTSDMCDG